MGRAGKERVAWVLVMAWTGAIYFGIPWANWIRVRVEGCCGRTCFIWLVLAAAALFLLGAARRIRAGKGAQWLRFCALGAVGLVYLYWTLKLRGAPEESVHFVEYGVLSCLLLRALLLRSDDALAWPAALLMCGIAGTVDEVIQWAMPLRVFDFRDVRLNAAAGLLALIVAALVLEPPFFSRPVRRRTARLVCLLAAMQLLIVAACLSNTPAVTAWLVRRMPFLEHVKHKDSFMAEYGYRNQDAQAGAFRSRFESAQLKQIDRARGAEAAAILERYGESAQYPSFLAAYTPLSDPFVHEARVHLFRRDEYFNAAMREPAGVPSRSLYGAIALRENLILENYFGETLRRSRHAWSSELISKLAAGADADLAYESPVSASLIVHFGVREVWGAALMGLFALGWVYRRLGDCPRDDNTIL
jgi:hypothetical protein